MIDFLLCDLLFFFQVMPSHYTQNHGGGKACVYKVSDYGAVLKCLKSNKYVEVEEIPWATFNVIERLSHSFAAERWIPCRPDHFTDEKVDELIGKLPKTLLEALLPFQLDGVKFGLQRGGRCLIADEMGLGKTLQVFYIKINFKFSYFVMSGHGFGAFWLDVQKFSSFHSLVTTF